MYAVIETGGKQLRVAEGDIIRTDLVELEAGAAVTFDRVLMAGGVGEASVGTPLLGGASVTGTVVGQRRDRKILVFKYKPKKRVRKLRGHRQPFAEVRIDKITLP